MHASTTPTWRGPFVGQRWSTVSFQGRYIDLKGLPPASEALLFVREALCRCKRALCRLEGAFFLSKRALLWSKRSLCWPEKGPLRPAKDIFRRTKSLFLSKRAHRWPVRAFLAWDAPYQPSRGLCWYERALLWSKGPSFGSSGSSFSLRESPY